MYGYVYITTNLINGKKYIGQHKSTTFSKIYKGSGKLILEAFNKYGKENFKTEILEWCDSTEEADQKEKYWINFYNSTNPEIGYNILKGGQSGSYKGMHHSEEAKKIMSLKKKGIKFSQETCQKISDNRKGIKHTEESCLKISKGLKEYWLTHPHPNTYREFKPLPEEVKNKISESHKGKKASLETKEKMSKAHRGSKHKPHKPHNYPKNRKSKLNRNNTSNSGEAQQSG